MKVLIVGASGLVGSHCYEIIKNSGYEAFGTYNGHFIPEMKHLNPLESNLETFFYQYNFMPDVIVHCAGLTNVDFCEDNFLQSQNQNIQVTKLLADFCTKKSIKLVYFSTDYIFDGLNGPYSETELPNPINTYGKHKLESEKIVLSLKNSLVIRITNVYGEEDRNKNLISRTINNLNSGIFDFSAPIDQFATPIYARDIGRMLILLLEDNKNGIYHFASTDYYFRYQLLLKLRELLQIEFKITPYTTEKSNHKTKRPLNGGLKNNKFVLEYPNFKFTNLDSYILKIKNDAKYFR